MKFYALIIVVTLWSVIRFVKIITDDCCWIDVPFEIEQDWIFYPLAIMYFFAISVATPIIVGCILFIICF